MATVKRTSGSLASCDSFSIRTAWSLSGASGAYAGCATIRGSFGLSSETLSALILPSSSPAQNARDDCIGRLPAVGRYAVSSARASMSELLKELAKVDKTIAFDAAPVPRASSSKKAPSQSIASSLDSLLDSLREFKHGIEAGATSAEVLGLIARAVDDRKKEMDDRQKEVYNALGKLGKALDKVCTRLAAPCVSHSPPAQKFPTTLPEWDPVFTSDASTAALDRTVALHLIRTGQFATAGTFVEVCSHVTHTEDVLMYAGVGCQAA